MAVGEVLESHLVRTPGPAPTRGLEQIEGRFMRCDVCRDRGGRFSMLRDRRFCVGAALGVIVDAERPMAINGATRHEH